MKKQTFVSIVLILMVLNTILFLSSAASEETPEENNTSDFGTTNVASDRTFEKTGGISSPEPLDKYMKRHFDAIRTRVEQIDSKMKDVDKHLVQIHEEIQRDFELHS